MWRALVVMVLDAIGRLTVSQSNTVWDPCFIHVQYVGHLWLGVDVADIGREGVGWYLPGDGVALGRRIGCRVRSRSIGVAAVLGPKQCRQERR